MLRSTTVIRLVVLMVLLATLSVALGSDPWGPW
jgi:hypothetical protein